MECAIKVQKSRFLIPANHLAETQPRGRKRVQICTMMATIYCGSLRHKSDPHRVIPSGSEVPLVEVFQQCLLGVHTVFGFVPDDAVFAVDNVGTDFFTTVGGQAVHEQGIAGGQ